MYVSGLSSASLRVADAELRELPRELRRETSRRAARRARRRPASRRCAGARVLAARVAQADHEQIERRGALAPTEEAH